MTGRTVMRRLNKDSSSTRTNTNDFLSTRNFSYQKKTAGVSCGRFYKFIMMRQRIYPFPGINLCHHQYLFTFFMLSVRHKNNEIFKNSTIRLNILIFFKPMAAKQLFHQLSCQNISLSFRFLLIPYFFSESLISLRRVTSSLGLGGSAGASSFLLIIRFMALIRRNTQKATIMKSIIV